MPWPKKKLLMTKSYHILQMLKPNRVFLMTKPYQVLQMHLMPKPN